jgi:Fe-S-cluster containining protein
MMTGGAWNEELFGAELAAALITELSGPLDGPLLARVVAECAAAAEAACCDRPMACAAGCPHCCVLNVAILLPEAMVITEWLRANLSPASFAVVPGRLAPHNSWARWMDDEERIARRTACPLLDSAGSCSVHPVRPLACRGVASLDRESCREAFNPIISDQERLVPADLLRRAAFDAAFKALALALRYHGLDDRSIELGCGVLAFLERSGYRESFLAGGRLPRELWG